jgi:acyl carrier protein
MAMNNDDAITQQVIAIFGEYFRVPSHELIAAANLSEDLGLDSLDVMHVLLDLEECFDIEFPNDAAARLQTLADVASYVRRRISTREEISDVARLAPHHAVSAVSQLLESAAEPLSGKASDLPRNPRVLRQNTHKGSGI